MTAAARLYKYNIRRLGVITPLDVCLLDLILDSVNANDAHIRVMGFCSASINDTKSSLV